MSARLIDHAGGAAAAEMALVLPFLLIILFGSFEAGNYFLSQHILIKGLRDGATYAARQDFATNYDCSAGNSTVSPEVVSETESLVRTGQLTGGADRLPNWNDAGTAFSIKLHCVTAAGGTPLGGMYAANGGKVPVITVSAKLPYRSVLGTLGFDTVNLDLGASQQAAATGL